MEDGLEEFEQDEPSQESEGHVDCGDCSIIHILAALYHVVIHSVLSRIAELVLTIGDFFGCIVAISIILHCYLLVGTASNYGCFLMWFFGLMSANMMLIPLWSFFQFSYFKDHAIPWEYVWRLFASPFSPPSVPKDKYMYSFQCCECEYWLLQVWPILESIFGGVCVAALLQAAAGKDHEMLDSIMFGVIVVLPLIKLSLMCIAYLWNFWAALINCAFCCDDNARDIFAHREDRIRDPFVYSLYGILRLWIGPGGGCNSPFCCSDDPVAERTPKCLKVVQLIFEIAHLVASMMFFAWVVSLAREENLVGAERKRIIIALVIFFIVFVPLCQIQFPFFLIDMICAIDCCDLLRNRGTMKSDNDFHSEMNVKKKMRKFRNMSITMYFFLVFAMAGLTSYIQGVGKDRGYPDLAVADAYTYKGQPPEPTVNQIKEIVSEVCYVKPYQLKMIQIAALAAASYYNRSDPSTEALLTEFFNDTGISIDSDSIQQMDVNQYKYGTATAFQFSKQNLTVVSIRGSTEAIDWVLDAQLFASSLLLTISTVFSFFTTTITPYTNVKIRQVIASPLYVLKPLTLTNKFIADLRSWYDGIDKNANILFVGHSLGGGLAKLFGHIYGAPSVSISGPGVAVVQQLFDPVDETDLPDNKYETRLISQSELIPDFDVVPRFEVTAGTRYRILCNRGVISCHGIGSTICMLGIMCETEHREFCESAGYWEISKETYDGMVTLARGQ